MEFSFVPSQVSTNFMNSVFQNAEKEILAFHFLTFLIEKGDSWETEIRWKDFFDHTERELTMTTPVLLIYNQPFSSIIGQQVVNSLYKLIEEDYLEWVITREILKVTPKMVEFYSHYCK